MGSERIDSGRRGLLLGGLASLTAPAWLASAFAAEGPAKREKELFDAWHQARRSGLILLVVIVPEDSAKWERGTAIGATLNHATDALMARLSRYQPACATVEELGRLGVQVAAGDWFALVQASELPAAGRGIAGPPAPVVPRGTSQWPGDEEADARIEGWITGVTSVLEGALDAVPVTPQAVEAGRERWVSKLPGSHWANGGGCGVQIEDYEDNIRIGCGMGHVPAKARRMLYFFEPGTY